MIILNGGVFFKKDVFHSLGRLNGCLKMVVGSCFLDLMMAMYL